MLDFIMLSVMAACCGLIVLLIHWCHKQIEYDG